MEKPHLQHRHLGASPAPVRGPLARLAILAVFVAFTSGSARAVPGEFTWGAIDTVDTGTIRISSSSGRSVAGVDDGAAQSWHIVFLKDGRVYHAARTQDGWGPPEAISPEGIQAANPQIARAGAVFHVVWEDSRIGHPEIWSRRSTVNGGWTEEECLTFDLVSSSAPSLDGEDAAILAWSDAVSSQTIVRAAIWDNGAWSAPVSVSASGALATEPSASISKALPQSRMNATVAWTDFRHGSPEIYVRSRINGAWQAEQRLTNFPGPCFSPSVHTEECCYEHPVGFDQITFITFNNGINEAWCALSRNPVDLRKLSANGITSPRSAVAGFSFNDAALVTPAGPVPADLAVWKEGAESAPGRLFAQNVSGGLPDSQVFTEALLGGPVIGACEGEPLSGALVMWTEQSDTIQVLKTRIGIAYGCERDELVAPAALLVGPEGTPQNTIRIRDLCSESFAQRPYSARIRFDAPLNGSLTWDVRQPHPYTAESYPDSSGIWTISVRGGGCSSEGNAHLQLNTIDVSHWTGVRSPDIDGNCAVQKDDLAYVQDRLGSADFCADLDGSGLVDSTDLGIVATTMGDTCTVVDAAGVEDGRYDPRMGPGADPSGVSGDTGLTSVRVLPNPAREAVAFQVEVQSQSTVSVRILDAGGRCVRDLGIRSCAAGKTTISWDTKDEPGRKLPAGVYFVSLRTGSEDTRRSVILLGR